MASVIKAELSLERIDAIADLSALATKYFSEDPNAFYSEPDAKMVNAFAWSVSEMWDEYESALYVLTRLAKLVDDRGSDGELSIPARAIRSFAEKSEARRVYMTTVESSTSQFVMGSSEPDANDRLESVIENLYICGSEAEADAKVVEMIQERWINGEGALKSIEKVANEGKFYLMNALIKIGSNHPSLKLMAPEWKASLCLKILSLPNAQIHPSTAKWLLTMETYREDQLKLVKTIEKALKKRADMGEEKMMKSLREKNNLKQIFGEIETIMSAEKTTTPSALKEDYFHGVSSIDDLGSGSKAFYKKMKSSPKQKGQKSIKMVEKKAEKRAEKELDTETQNQAEQQVQVNQEQPEQQVNQEKNANPHKGEIDFFEEQRKQDEAIEKIVYDTNTEPLYDDDGVYDDDERRRDRTCQIVVVSLIGVIIASAVGTYIYLRARRARRNRTMLVVTEALETVA